MGVQLVVFDMAGTTVYDGDAVNRCLVGALGEVGVHVSRDEVNAVMGIAKPVAIKLLLDSHNASNLCVDAIFSDFQGRMLSFYESDPAVAEVSGARNVFAKLRGGGVKVALDTGFSREIADTILRRLGWSVPEILDATVTSDEVAHGRPFPDMIYAAMKITGVADVTCVAKVGDTPSDLQEGMAAGCRWVVGVTEGSHTRDELADFPHTHLIPTVAALPAVLGIDLVA